MLDAAHNAQHLGLIAVFLDWAKAFDKVKHEALLQELKRSGIPEPMLLLIGAICAERSFMLKDPAGGSSIRQQRAGIAQRCPLSQHLFIILQTVMFYDADQIYNEMAVDWQEPDYIACSDILYADDTMLVSANEFKLQVLLDLTIEIGSQCGLDLNWNKTVVMQINNTGMVYDSFSNPLKVAQQA
eukprot:3860059-Pyramimonas_sp.AAC.1